MAYEEKESYVIFRRQVRAFLKLARRKGEPEGREICGLIVFNGYCLDLVLTRNKAKKAGSFHLPPREVRKIKRAARKLKHRVVGTFHSHPFSAAEPGESDIAGAEEGALMLIFSCWYRDARLWRIRKKRAYPVQLHCLGLTSAAAVFDCCQAGSASRGR